MQEAWLRWQKTDRTAVVSPVAFLSSTTTRLAINVAQSAHVRRETYIGPWLPEPVDTSSDPEVGVQRTEALELALLLVLEKLTPAERAAYVLKEAFDYACADIAEMLQLTVVNVRKIVSRARKQTLDLHDDRGFERRHSPGHVGAQPEQDRRVPQLTPPVRDRARRPRRYEGGGSGERAYPRGAGVRSAAVRGKKHCRTLSLHYPTSREHCSALARYPVDIRWDGALRLSGACHAAGDNRAATSMHPSP